MICKFCNAQIEDDSELCPVCGMPLTEETVEAKEALAVEDMPACDETRAEEVPVEETSAEETSAEETSAEETSAEETSAEETSAEAEAAVTEPFVWRTETPAAPKVKVWHIVLAVVGAVLSLCVLAVVLLAALGVELKIPANDILRKEVYAVSEESAVKKGDGVIAKVGDAELTNARLQIYYQMKILDFVNYYSSYLSTVGFDYTQPLSQQTCYFDESMTWEQYFIDASIQSWSNYQALCLAADKAGFVLSEELEAELAKIPESLETQAAESGYASADEMIKALLGPACDIDDYMEYVRTDMLANAYYASEYEKLIPTDEEVETYFGENEEAFAQNGITKDCGLVSSVRHILVCPKAEEAAAEDTEAATEATEPAAEEGFTEEQWAACLAEAEKILQEWKDGEATEESFAALVATYTEDTGSASTGGLYEGINPTSNYVENFLNWSVDMTRQPGDTGIVQSEFGYHIMYFVKGSPYWIDSAKTQLLSERTSAFLDSIKEHYPTTANYKKIVISEPKLG